MQAVEQDRSFSPKELSDLQLAIDATSIVAITDVKGTITYVNEKFCEISFYSRDELVGKNHRILNSGHHPREFWENMYQTVAAGRVWTDQICNRAKDGSLYWVETTIMAGKNDQGKIERYIAIRTDITLQKILEQSLLQLVEEQTSELRVGKELAEQAQATAELANQAKSDFLANMSHELRTPMHSIISFSKFGLKQILSRPLEQKGIDKIERFFSNINDSGQRLLQLLNNLLDLAKLESGKTNYIFGAMELAELVRSVAVEFSTQLNEKDIELVVDERIENSIVYCDAGKIRQVVVNLLSNAVKFTSQSSSIKITLANIEVANGSNNKKTVILFSIADQGVGVPIDELQTVFDYFSQSSKTDSGAGGTGLGLAICKEIVEAHNGQIWLENNKDGGATIRFSLHKTNWLDDEAE